MSNGSLDALRQRVDDTLRPLLAEAPAVALLDFPSHSNVGESAIWLGELAALRRIGAPAPAYTCALHTYDPGRLARRVGKGAILFTGGGSFGDLYERHLLFRESVIAAFPHNLIVQLPETIHYQNRQGMERTRAVLAAHPNFTLLVRDQASLDIARTQLRAPAVLCPDMAFALDPLPVSAVSPSRPLLWLKRSDSESRWTVQGGGAPTTDWLDEPWNPVIRAAHVARRIARRYRWSLAAAGPLLSALYPSIARIRLARGVALLRSARVVVTDRLHAHLLCVLLGIPHVLLENSYGKLRRVYETWTAESPLVRFAASPAEAESLAGELLRDGPVVRV
jgi:pyruvyl transferase EpsO